MNNNELNSLEEILKMCGYRKKKCENEDLNNVEYTADIDSTGGAANNCCANLNLDIPGGFQDLNPVVFIIIGELIGNIIAGQIPFNVAVSISNWLNLVGQAIETYSAQQAYFQSGPGRVYAPEYKNVTNPFCTCTEVNENTESFSSMESQVNGLQKNIEDLQNKNKEYFKQVEKLNKIIEELQEHKKC